MLFKYRGDCFFKLKKYPESISDYSRAIELGSKRYKERGLAYFQIGEYEKSILDYKKELKEYPKSYITYFYMAEAYEKLGESEKAIKCYKESAKGYSKARSLLSSRGIKFERKQKKASQDDYCYSLGYRYGKCSAKSMKGLPCDPQNDIIIPNECRNKVATQVGIEEGMRSVN